MKAILVAIFALFIGIIGYTVWSFAPPPMLAAASDEFALTDVRVIEPMLGKTESASILIARGKIARIEEMGTATDPDSPYRDHFVLPGLINAHVHLPNQTPLHLSEFVGLLYLRHGVTTVRVAGDTDGTGSQAAIKAFTEAGHPGPRINSCRAFVGGAGKSIWANTLVLERPEQAAGIINQLKAQGANCVKAYDGLDAARTRALVAAAQNAGLPVIGHVPADLLLESSPVPNVQHLLGTAKPVDPGSANLQFQRFHDWRQVDEARLAQVVQISATNAITHTPTLSAAKNFLNFEDFEKARESPAALMMPRLFTDAAWHPAAGVMSGNISATDFETVRDGLPKKLSLVLKLHEAGIPLMLGTDDLLPFTTPGISLWQEMRLFAEAGIPLPEIWAYGTRRAGNDFSVPWLGYIREGAPADLLVFEKDPTQDLANLGTLRAVVRDGKLYPVEDLDQAIEAYQAYYKRPLVDFVSVNLTKRIVAKSATVE